MFKWLRESLPSAMDELESFTEAQNTMLEQGIFPPAAPNRMECAPTWHSVMDAVDKGVALAEAMGEAAGRSNEETAADAGFFGIVYGFTQFVKDGASIQKCMDKQDEVHQKETAEYIEQVKEVAKPVPHDPRRLDPNLTYERVMEVRAHENTKRYIKGMPQIPLTSPIWDGYNWETSYTNGHQSVFAGSADGVSNIFNNNSSGGGLLPDQSGRTIDMDNSSNGIDRDSSSGNNGVEISVCLRDGNGGFTDCWSEERGNYTGNRY